MIINDPERAEFIKILMLIPMSQLTSLWAANIDSKKTKSEAEAELKSKTTTFEAELVKMEKAFKKEIEEWCGTPSTDASSSQSTPSLKN